MSYWLLLGSLPALPAPRSVRLPPQIQLPKARPVRRLVAVSCTHRHTHRACTPMHARGFPRVCSHTHICISACTRVCSQSCTRTCVPCLGGGSFLCLSEAVAWAGSHAEVMIRGHFSSLLRLNPALCRGPLASVLRRFPLWPLGARLALGGEVGARVCGLLRSCSTEALPPAPAPGGRAGSGPTAACAQATRRRGDRQPPAATPGCRKGRKCLPAGRREDATEVPRGLALPLSPGREEESDL